MSLDLAQSRSDQLLIGLGSGDFAANSSQVGSFLNACYAVSFADVECLIRTEVFLEYVPSVTLQPLPRASARVLGLMQRRGQILPVFDASLRASKFSVGKPLSVLIIGNGPRAGAVAIQGQPRLVNPQPLPQGTPTLVKPQAHHCVFHRALDKTPSFDALSNRLMWSLDIEQFFLTLSSNNYLK